ncbi:MAG: nucleoside-diphosphate kinase, partial [Candidatus Thermoplasmatota archaeon]|nr:nucleoside-diphosphate kinase [Candidatus Thermoplasmatota archaeon]
MSDAQTTFIMIKPDGVERGLADEIIGRFEGIGLRMLG